LLLSEGLSCILQLQSSPACGHPWGSGSTLRGHLGAKLTSGATLVENCTPSRTTAHERWRLGSGMGICCRGTLGNSRRIKRIMQILCGPEAAI